MTKCDLICHVHCAIIYRLITVRFLISLAIVSPLPELFAARRPSFESRLESAFSHCLHVVLVSISDFVQNMENIGY